MNFFYSSDNIIYMPFKIILVLFCLFSLPASTETINLGIIGNKFKIGVESTLNKFLSGVGARKTAEDSGTLTFQDGTKYIGSFKNDIIHGPGKFIDLDGNINEGKWRYGKLTIKIDEKTRKVIKINRLSGASNYFETKGTGSLSNKWFESEPKIINIKEVEKISEVNFFNQPSAIFSSVYSDQKKIKKILEAKNLKTSSDPKNMKVKYQLTSKGKKDLRIAKIKQRF